MNKQKNRNDYTDTQSRASKAKKHIGLLIAILLVLLAAGIGLFILLTRPSPDAEDTETELPMGHKPSFAESGKDAAEPAAEETTSLRYVTLNPGEIVFFGAYEQDGNDANGKEAVEWIVLDRDGEYALLLSRYVLDSRLYNEAGGTSSWSECSLRAWMNGQMLDELFDEEMQSAVRTTEVPDEGNGKYGIQAGKTTRDKLFLLSRNEVEKYFPAEGERTAYATYYAKMNGAKEMGGDLCCWWALRSTGKSYAYIDHVWFSGRIDADAETDCGAGGIRPALWVKLPLGVKEYSDTTQEAALPVVGLPEIRYYPETVTAKVGEQVCIPVLATGAESYQWYCRKPGDSAWTEVPNTAGKGSVCMVKAKTGNDGYEYYCVISNGSGTVETGPITLTVGNNT